MEDFNAQIHQKNYRTTDVLFTANLYDGEERWWVPWSYDYRGRVYPQLTSLSPQGTDLDKSLIYFADEGPVNEEWLAWHCATTYGHDKLTHADRIAWTRDNLELITAVAEDPIGNLLLWANEDSDGNPKGEPWCFLAAALEYHACCIAKTKTTSGLPVGIDATCSGLQHLSAMTLDGVAAAEVNVTPSEQIADGYKTVAEAARKHIEHPEVLEVLDQNVTKRVVMTTPYGVSRNSARDYIKSSSQESRDELACSNTVDAIYLHAVPEVFGSVK